MFGGGDAGGGWTAGLLRRFVDARAGRGGVWRLEGNLIALGTGRVLADIVGVDEAVVARGVAPLGDDARARQLASANGEEALTLGQATHGARLVTRAALFYLEPGSSRRMRAFRFRPTTPSRAVAPAVTNASALHVGRDAAGALTLARGAARVLVAPPARAGSLRAAWAYIARPAKKRKDAPARPGAVETFDWVVDGESPTMSWTRVSRCPSWYGGGQCLTRLSGSRVDGGWSKLDAQLRMWLGEVGRSRPLKASDIDV